MQSGFFWGTGGALLGGSSLGLPLKLMRSDNWILSVHHLLQHRRRRRRSTAPTCTCFLTSWLRVTPSKRQILFICVLMAPGEMRVLAILCTETATDQTLPPFIWTEPVIKDETKAVSFLSSLQERHLAFTPQNSLWCALSTRLQAQVELSSHPLSRKLLCPSFRRESSTPVSLFCFKHHNISSGDNEILQSSQWFPIHFTTEQVGIWSLAQGHRQHAWLSMDVHWLYGGLNLRADLGVSYKHLPQTEQLWKRK